MLAAGPVGAGADPVGVGRAGRRARGGQGRRDRLPGEVGLARGAARRRTPGGRRRHRVHARPRRAGAGGVPPDGRPGDRDRRQPQLTERETEVLKMVAKGMSYKQIAERLVLSHRTVQNHVQNTLRKLQMHNRVELTRYAIEQGLDDGLRQIGPIPHRDRPATRVALRPTSSASPTSMPSGTSSMLGSSPSRPTSVLDPVARGAGRGLRHRGGGRRTSGPRRVSRPTTARRCGTWRSTPSWWGQGVAPRRGRARGDPASALVARLPGCWCLVDNQPAFALYERLGWQATGRRAAAPSGRRTRPRSSGAARIGA